MAQILLELLLFILFPTHCQSDLCSFTLSQASDNYVNSVDGHCFVVYQETFISPQITADELGLLFTTNTQARVKFHAVAQEDLQIYSTLAYIRVYDEAGNFMGEHGGIFIPCIERNNVPDGVSLVEISSVDYDGQQHIFFWIVLKFPHRN